MTHEEQIVLVASAAVFVVISGMIIAIGLEIDRRKKLRDRIKNSGPRNLRSSADPNSALVTSDRKSMRINIELLADLITEENRTKLRNDLIKAGVFDAQAPAVFVAMTIACILLMAVSGAIVVRMFYSTLPIFTQMIILCTCAYAGYFIPDAYLRSRKASLKREYLQVFPDFLDLLVVCIGAGLSLNAAIDRVTTDFYNRSFSLSTNFAAMLQEIRSGREMVDALDNLSNRIDVEEIRSFCTLVKQSLELGSDVSDALRVYSDEMRVKRMLRAEEEANKLPVKMLLPLGLFIFPVIMIVILTPIVVRVAKLSH